MPRGWDLSSDIASSAGNTNMHDSVSKRPVKSCPKSFLDAGRDIKTLLAPLNERERKTVDNVLSVLVKSKGGAIFVLCHKQLSDDLRINVLDNCAMRNLLQRYSKNLHEKPEQFLAIMRAFREHTESDRWEEWLIERLARQIGADVGDPLLAALKGQPKDGAITLSMNGTILCAGGRLAHEGSCQLIKPNGLCAGTRHAAALGVTEWLGEKWRECGCVRAPGVVFAASDTGDVSVMFPDKDGTPSVWQVAHAADEGLRWTPDATTFPDIKETSLRDAVMRNSTGNLDVPIASRFGSKSTAHRSSLPVQPVHEAEELRAVRLGVTRMREIKAVTASERKILEDRIKQLTEAIRCQCITNNDMEEQRRLARKSTLDEAREIFRNMMAEGFRNQPPPSNCRLTAPRSGQSSAAHLGTFVFPLGGS